MSLSLIDQIKLRIKVGPPLPTKGSPLTWVEEDTNFEIIYGALLELATASTEGFDAYNNATIYSDVNPDYVVYDGNIWEFINPTPASGVTPGTDPLTWQLTSSGLFTHIKNRDLLLDEGGVNEVSAADLRALLDNTPGDISDLYTYIDGKVSDTAYNATSWNGVTTIAPSKNAVRDEIEAIYSAIAGIDLTPLWNKNGNTLSARGKLGSTSGAYGLDFYVNNVVYGGFSNAGKDYWGGSSAFTDTDHSYYGSGNTNATYNSQWKNSDSTVLGWMRNDGVLYSKNLLVGYASGFGGDSLSEFWGTTSDNTAFSAKFRASSFDVMAQIRNDGVSAFRSILINPASLTTGDDPNVAFSIYGGATDNASVYIAKFRKGDFATAFDIVSNGNLKMGEASDSFGGGEGVFQIGNAQTTPSSDPTNAFLMYSGSGVPTFRLPTGTIINLDTETTGVSASTFTANSSGIANDTATFDGYTIGQVVKALRNRKLLT